MKRGYTLLESVIVIGVILILVSVSIGSTAITRKYKLMSDVAKIKNINIAASSLVLSGMKKWSNINSYNQTKELFRDYLSEEEFEITSQPYPIYMYVKGNTLPTGNLGSFVCLSSTDGDSCDYSNSPEGSQLTTSAIVRGTYPSIFFADTSSPPSDNQSERTSIYSNIPKKMACELEEIIDDNDLAWGFGRTCSGGTGCGSVKLDLQIQTSFTDKINCFEFLQNLQPDTPFQEKSYMQSGSQDDPNFIAWSMFLDVPTGDIYSLSKPNNIK